ncbi:hypothetical protein VOLCADRAFT_96181 [Volvox carteri f. nagariensis]|uniref:Uncharacterized protein n=1 Tax=Volvox carteri f. nagariensis TaxID=3068 RepID=D8U9F3_VOLCA|nr:uncharacterized protein VOLCADRAFT_96181 [Volvox carteri f. nagariensis]EFJ43574.1 hypothetical protein VOLCADRAFT_96181 [Volvox carteri f. nagariensis]|eukprot:XP_002955274.1 hypothetical protein VOLCADRAFT_96181 [Volvox carteri f. nagariensis]
MERLSDSDSDDDDSYHPLGSLVLRPAITEPASPAILWSGTDGNVLPGSEARQCGAIGGIEGAPSARPAVRAASDEVVPSPLGVTGTSGPDSSLTVVSPSVTAATRAPAPSATSSNEVYEGRGWLVGAAGRLANTAELRRAHATATDAEQVADAARLAAALQQHRQQQQRSAQQQQQHGEEAAVEATGAAAAGYTVAAGLAAGTGGVATAPDVAVAAAAATAAAAAEQQRQQRLQQEREELELLILKDFQEAIKAAESEGPLVAPSGLTLDSTVAGLGLDDLDALIARLTAGTADLEPTGRPGHVAAAGALGSLASSTGSPGAVGGSVWTMEPLPAADSLWSDEEEDRTEGEVRHGAREVVVDSEGGSGRGQREPAGKAAMAVAAAGPVAAVAEAAVATLPPVAVVVREQGTEAVAPTAAGPQVPAPGAAGSTTGPLPAKFKFFAGPAGAGGATAPPPPPWGAAAAAAGGGSGPVVLDLRQSIAEKAQRNSREAEALEAQRRSRRLAAASSDSSSGGGGGESTDDGDRVDGKTAVPEVRPVPPAPLPAASTAPEAAAAAPPPAPPASKAASPPLSPPSRVAAAAGGSAGAAAAAAPEALARINTALGNPAATRPTRGGRTLSDATVATVTVPSKEAISSGGDGGATASTAVATARCISVGIDAADCRPASRSVFVCTTERQAEEEERVRDIREYLKARAAAAAEAAERQRQEVSATAAPRGAEERRWPEPPAAVAERIAVLTERQAAAATAAAAASASTATAPKTAQPRAVATYAGGDGDGTESRLANGGGHDAGSDRGPVGASRALPGRTPDATPAAASVTFAACSTEGDEDLVAAPTPASVSDARTERGARMAAAGTVIPLGRPSAHSTSSAPAFDADAAATAAVALVSPVAPSSITATVRSAAVAAAGPPLPLPEKSPAAAAGMPADLYRLPAWLPHASCFTLLITSPGNLSSREVGAVLEWLLRAAAAVAVTSATATAAPASRAATWQELPAFSVVGVRLLAVSPSWPPLPPAPKAAAPVGKASSGSDGDVGIADVRVLAVACVPRAGIDADAYSHELPATAAADAAAAATTAQRLAEALAAVPWSAILLERDEKFAAGGGGVASRGSAIPGGHEALRGWLATQPGAQLLFSPLRLPPHAFSQHQHRASSSCAVASPGATAGGNAAATVADAPGITTFVSVVTAGTLRNPHLLRRLLDRAACLGLTLQGLQVVYSTEEAAAAVVAATPHRPLAYTGAAVLALSGRNEPLRRWQATLGPPDARLACRTDPSSLHALYGDVARHITCSYDDATAARELTVLFAGHFGAAGQPTPASPPSPSPRQQQQHPQGRLQPTSTAPSVANKGAAAAAAAAAAATCGLVGGSPAEAQWLALPAAGAAQQARALWCLQHLLWCGYSLGGMLLMHLPREPCSAPAPPALIFEVSKEEATEQLPLSLASVPSAPAYRQFVTAPAGAAALAESEASAVVRSLLSPDALRTRLALSDVQGLPQPYVAEQLLAAAAAIDAGLSPADDGESNSGGGGGVGGGGADSAAGMAALHLHHGKDEIAVVALQTRPLHTGALLLAALTAHATGSGGGSGSRDSGSPSSPDCLELVACRYLRQVPSDVANCLAVLHANQGSAAAGATAAAGGAGGVGVARVGHRLVISRPALLAAFHGPAAQLRVTRWLAAALQRFNGALELASPSSSTVPLCSDDAAWDAMLNQLLRDYATPVATAAAATAVQQPLAAVSGSQAAAKRALSYAFGPGHVFLDPRQHDGVHRPLLHTGIDVPGVAAASPTPLFRLLSGPEPLPAVVALDFAALHRNVLPRLLKQLSREGYVIHAASTCRVQPGSAFAAAMPALSAQPAVVLHVSRSNAVRHLRVMAATLAAPLAAATVAAGGGCGGGLYTCATWRDAVNVVAELWPHPPQPGADGPSLAVTVGAGGGAGITASGDGGVLASHGGAMGKPCARRFVRPEGSRLLQLTAMVVTPGAPLASPGDGVPPALDWPRLADTLQALHSEGFRLGAVRATAATPRDMSDLGRAYFRISSAQQYGIHASAAAAAAAAAATAAARGGQQSLMAPPPPPPQPPPCNLVLLALTRDSAVTSLQVLLDEAGRVASEAVRQGSLGKSQGPASVPGVLSALPGGGPGRRAAVAALAGVAPCVSVAHSPAAAEQQVVAVFEDVFGAGGVPLLQ